MIRTFWILASVFLRYFKVDWLEFEYMLSKNKTSPLLKKEKQQMFLWLKISFWKEKCKLDRQMLIYKMTWEYLLLFDGILEKVTQFR